MPTITHYRFWCNECNDFTLHNTTGDKSCRTCGTITETYNLSLIPKEKIIEQRDRYLKSNLNGLLSMFSLSNSMFSEVGSNVEIIECDAGQDAIDEENRKQRLIKETQLKELKDKFKNVNRNDICLCGSGKKFKKCCLNKIR